MKVFYFLPRLQQRNLAFFSFFFPPFFEYSFFRLKYKMSQNSQKIFKSSPIYEKCLRLLIKWIKWKKFFMKGLLKDLQIGEDMLLAGSDKRTCKRGQLVIRQDSRSVDNSFRSMGTHRYPSLSFSSFSLPCSLGISSICQVGQPWHAWLCRLCTAQSHHVNKVTEQSQKTTFSVWLETVHVGPIF